MFTIVVLLALAGCQPGQVTIPPHGDTWLSLKGGTGSDAETTAYYNTIDPTSAKDTFDKWKTANGFGANPIGSGPEIRAVYFNAADLQLGRDMHCKQTGINILPPGPTIACYVTNYGPPPYVAGAPNSAWPNPPQALADAVAAATGTPGNPPFATVAMEFTPLLCIPGTGICNINIYPNNVKFYAFCFSSGCAPGQPDGTRIKAAALDTEGPKFIPQMCIACHGSIGNYDTNIHAAWGASFLEFDVFTFQYSDSPFRRSDQEEAFRKLNALVEATTPNPNNLNHPIESLINNWYKSCGGVNVPGCAATDYSSPNNLPPGWVGSGQVGADTYFGVVRYYCQTCHISEASNVDWTTYNQFKNAATSIQSFVCSSHYMPHAQVPYEHFWTNILAVAALQEFMQSQGITTCP